MTAKATAKKNHPSIINSSQRYDSQYNESDQQKSEQLTLVTYFSSLLKYKENIVQLKYYENGYKVPHIDPKIDSRELLEISKNLRQKYNDIDKVRSFGIHEQKNEFQCVLKCNIQSRHLKSQYTEVVLSMSKSVKKKQLKDESHRKRSRNKVINDSELENAKPQINTTKYTYTSKNGKTKGSKKRPIKGLLEFDSIESGGPSQDSLSSKYQNNKRKQKQERKSELKLKELRKSEANSKKLENEIFNEKGGDKLRKPTFDQKIFDKYEYHNNGKLIQATSKISIGNHYSSDEKLKSKQVRKKKENSGASTVIKSAKFNNQNQTRPSGKLTQQKAQILDNKQGNEKIIQSNVEKKIDNLINSQNSLEKKFNQISLNLPTIPRKKPVPNQIQIDSQDDILSNDETKSNPQGGGNKWQREAKNNKNLTENQNTQEKNNQMDCDSLESQQQKQSMPWGEVIEKMRDDQVIYKMIYQNQGRSSDISINKGDFLRLEPGVYLNDIIINFYLKFLENYVFKTEQQSQLYIFNSYLMQKLKGNNNNAGSLFDLDYHMDARKAFIQNYNSLKRWTKNIDLFKKKFIMVPICEAEHWSLAIICYPDLVGQLMNEHVENCISGKIPSQNPQPASQQEKEVKSAQKSSTVDYQRKLQARESEVFEEGELQKKDEEMKDVFEGGDKTMNMTLPKQQKQSSLRQIHKQKRIQFGQSDSCDEEDENEQSEDNMEDEDEFDRMDYDESDYDSSEYENDSQYPDYMQNHQSIYRMFPRARFLQRQRRPQPAKVDTSKPFILYMDSMNPANEHSMQALRSYIEMEFIDKKIAPLNPTYKTYFEDSKYQWKGLDFNMMPCYQPQIPKQKNSYDCGLYLLEYAEIFVEDEEFITQNLLQTDVKLFKTRWVDLKRDIIKRIIIDLTKINSPAEVGSRYSKWRSQVKPSFTHLRLPPQIQAPAPQQDTINSSIFNNSFSGRRSNILEMFQQNNSSYTHRDIGEENAANDQRSCNKQNIETEQEVIQKSFENQDDHDNDDDGDDAIEPQQERNNDEQLMERNNQ